MPAVLCRKMTVVPLFQNASTYSLSGGRRDMLPGTGIVGCVKKKLWLSRRDSNFQLPVNSEVFWIQSLAAMDDYPCGNLRNGLKSIVTYQWRASLLGPSGIYRLRNRLRLSSMIPLKPRPSPSPFTL